MEQKYVILSRIGGIVLIAMVIFLAISLLTHSAADPPDGLLFPMPRNCQNWCGQAGAFVSSLLFRAVGYSAYLLLLPMIAGIVFCWNGKKPDQIFLRSIGFLLILLGVSGLSVSFLGQNSPGPLIGPGGYLGITVHTYLKHYFATTGSTIIYGSFVLAGILMSCDYSLLRLVLWTFGVYPLGDFIVNFFKKRSLAESLRTTDSKLFQKFNPGRRRSRKQFAGEKYPLENNVGEDDEEDIDDEEDEGYREHGNYAEYDEDSEKYEEEMDHDEEPGDEEYGIASEKHLKTRHHPTARPESILRKETPVETDVLDEEDEEIAETMEYELPSIEHLMESAPYNYKEQEKTAQKQAKLLEEAFAAFGFNINVVAIQTGPVISQFEVQLERGLRLSKIMNLTDDLAVALKVPTVRIVAPIPGKNTVGVEVPNADRQLVRLRDVMEDVMEKTTAHIEKMAIPIFLGKDVAGKPMVIDMAKMPHLLIAGRTGTGKSVCLNSIIVSMLMTRRPDECRMIMIDPKLVELSPYTTIPHLMHPVVTDMQKAEAILAWAVDKMEMRYQMLARAGVRHLSEFNKLNDEELYRRVKPESDEEWESFPRSLPYLVIIADEMADLMMTAAKEVETHIIRLAQKSRAVGIHLILATQKPTVDIITGLIKSNLPARIAFEVASQTDSRVVIDRNGAEKLLGNGDMLFLQPGTSQVIRGQGTYVSDKEIDEIISLIGTEEPDYIAELVALRTDGEAGGDVGETDSRDELYHEAVEYVIRSGRGSLSLLQRKFKVGYGRAARLIDFMAEDGIVGEYKGSQAREVLISLNEWRKRLAGPQEPEKILGPIKTIKPKLVPVKPVKPVKPKPASSPMIHPLVQEIYGDEEEYDEEYNVDNEDTMAILSMSEATVAAPKENLKDEKIRDDDDDDDDEEYNGEDEEYGDEEDEDDNEDEEYEYVYEEWDGETDDDDVEYEYIEYEEEEEEPEEEMTK